MLEIWVHYVEIYLEGLLLVKTGRSKLSKQLNTDRQQCRFGSSFTVQLLSSAVIISNMITKPANGVIK